MKKGCLSRLYNLCTLSHSCNNQYFLKIFVLNFQHLEIAIWCIRHRFLEHVRSRHANFTSWRNLVRERKSAAITRAWPLAVPSADSTGQGGSLFIEDALANLDIEQAYDQEIGEESDFAFLQKNGALSFFRSKIEGMTGCYPFESLQAAVDILFLRGSSDLVVAKQAIVSFSFQHEFHLRFIC